MYIMVLGLRGFPGVEGGVETHCQHLYPLLVELGCKIDVIVRSRYAYHDAQWHGVRFQRIWAPQGTGLEALIHSFIGVLYAGLKRPDILHIHAIGPAVVAPLARLLGLHVVVTHHGPDYHRDKWGWLARTVLHLGENFGMRFAHKRIAISQVIHNLIKRKYGKDSSVIPNGVVIAERPEDTQALEKFRLSPGRYILQVSRFVPEKRQLDLIRAFSATDLPGWKLVLVGSMTGGDPYMHSVQVNAEKNDKVVLTGFQTGSALRELYGYAGLFVLPSSHEGLPIALLEAMSFGIPVLASDIPANREIGLPDDSYFPVGNIDLLRDSLHASVLRGFDAERSVRQSAIIRERYDWKKIAQSTYMLYEELDS